MLTLFVESYSGLIKLPKMIQRTPQFPRIEMMRMMANMNVHKIESTVHGSVVILKIKQMVLGCTVIVILKGILLK